MKKSNKKGFTIVELVIVIAVIAILAAVLIPTFSNVIGKAKESEVLQIATASYKEAYAVALSNDGKITEADDKAAVEAATASLKVKWTVSGTSLTVSSSDYSTDYNITVVEGVVKVAKKSS